MTRILYLASVGGMLGLGVSPALAQSVAEHSVPCKGQVVSRIDIHTLPPFASGGPKFFDKLAHVVTALHAVTTEGVVRRFLTLGVGAQCTEQRRRDSELILLAQPFLADAHVRAFPDGHGGVRLDVTTVDEVSLILGGRVSTSAPVVGGIRLGEANLAGAGIYAAGTWQHNKFFRDAYRGRVVDYQFLGRPYQLLLEGRRNDIGGNWQAEMNHQFLTDLQRVAWRATAGSADGLFDFRRPNENGVAVRMSRTYADIGGVVRVGPPGRLFLVGGLISRERERTHHDPVMVSNAGIVPDTSSALIGRYGEHRSVRLNALLGFREVTFVRVQGFDALEGSQDVRTGVQLSSLLGRGIMQFGSDEEDYFVSGDVYFGAASPSSFAGVEMMGERRRDVATRDWDGGLASGRAAWYAKPFRRNTTIVSTEFSGGWRQRVPFQLTFADRDGGLRGYRTSALGGAQRLVARVEDRQLTGHIRQFAATGLAAFVDAGKLWAGDVPFGTTTGVKLSAGIGILAALPAKSRRLWRVDFAFPLNDRHDAKVEVRVTNYDFTRWFWREPGDVQSSRERSIPNSVYNWP